MTDWNDAAPSSAAARSLSLPAFQQPSGTFLFLSVREP